MSNVDYFASPPIPKCAGCGKLCPVAPHWMQLCFRCLRFLLPFEEGECTVGMIERVQARIVEKALHPGSSQPDDESILAFPITEVQAGTSVTLTIQPQITCKPRVLRLTEDTAKAFEIEDIMVGHRSQFAAAFSVSGKMFSESYQARFGYIPLKIDTVHLSMNFSMRVRNRIGIPATFEAIWDVEGIKT